MHVTAIELLSVKYRATESKFKKSEIFPMGHREYSQYAGLITQAPLQACPRAFDVVSIEQADMHMRTIQVICGNSLGKHVFLARMSGILRHDCREFRYILVAL